MLIAKFQRSLSYAVPKTDISHLQSFNLSSPSIRTFSALLSFLALIKGKKPSQKQQLLLKSKKGKLTSGNMILLFKRNLSPIITYFWTNSKGKKELKNRIPLKWFDDIFFVILLDEVLFKRAQKLLRHVNQWARQPILLWLTLWFHFF